MILTVITYDVSTEDADGKRRLRRVAKYCTDYGQRVQNSVFECYADNATLAHIKNDLKKIIDPEKDSLRFYKLGSKFSTKIEHVGNKASYDPEGFICL